MVWPMLGDWFWALWCLSQCSKNNKPTLSIATRANRRSKDRTLLVIHTRTETPYSLNKNDDYVEQATMFCIGRRCYEGDVGIGIGVSTIRNEGRVLWRATFVDVFPDLWQVTSSATQEGSPISGKDTSQDQPQQQSSSRGHSGLRNGGTR